MTKNYAPVFVNAFARGGSSIIWNLLQSHPDLVSPLEETHQLIIGNADDGSNRWKALVHLRHAAQGGGLPRPAVIDGHVFANFGLLDPGNYSRRRLPMSVRRELDDALFAGKGRNLTDQHFRWRTPDEVYTAESLATARLVSKNLEGIVWLSDELQDMYPDATFVALVRNGLAMCESQLRRGAYRSAHKFGVAYRLVIREMLAQAKRLKGYRIVRFEDLVVAPEVVLQDLYRHVGVDGSGMTHVRLKNKPHYRADGGYGRALDAGTHAWMEVTALSSFFNGEINAEQERRLSPEDRKAFLEAAEEEMCELGYL